MDGATRATILGISISAVVALVGFLLRNLLSGIADDIREHRKSFDRYSEREATRAEKSDARIALLEGWRMKIDERHHNEDRERR